MKLFEICWILCLILVPVPAASQRGCSLPLFGKWEKLSPILFHNDTSAIIPENGKIHLKKGQNITVICPDTRNYLTNTNSNASYAICEGGETLRVINRDYDYEDLQCKKTIRGTVSKSAQRCAHNKGQIYSIGYRLSRKHFFDLIKICYDDQEGNVFYTEHLIHGQGIKGASKSNYRPSFSPEGIGSDISVSVAYKQAFQKSTFNRLMKSSSVAGRYINEKSYLSRGHLSPDADFLFAAWQYTSYYYINTSPQWQSINGGNWKRIENMVRKTAEFLRETLVVITGNTGVLKLPDADGKMTDIFLVSGSKLPVPEYVWKIVYSSQSRKAVVLVVINNPFISRISEDVLLCEDICKEYRWDSNSWLDFERGFVYCCDYREFIGQVEIAPKLTVTGVLEGIN